MKELRADQNQIDNYGSMEPHMLNARSIVLSVFTTLIAAACTGQDFSAQPASPPANTDDSGASPVVPTNDTGIFVSSSKGNDNGDGTQESPVLTIGKALSLLGGKPNIYVCVGAGSYTEQVSLDESATVQGIYGGFDCATWQYSASNKPVVRSPSSDVALKIANVRSSVTISDIEFDAPIATNPGDSSIAAFVVNSNDVKFIRSVLVASSGQTGTSGQTGSNYEGTPAPSGNPANSSTGGATQTACVCANGDNSTGGAGGSIGTVGLLVVNPGASGTPDLGGGQGGGLPNEACVAGGQGYPGMSGNDGIPTKIPTAGTITSAFGSLDESGWHPATSAAGTIGSTGQGGGGGTYYSGGGGGGGCGGCGGAGGGSAQGGGASVALLSLQSTITFTNASLTAGQAGSGGPGAPGQPGQGGGTGGAGYAVGCQGGAGGNGGNGGASAGGAGGIAAGVLWSGLAPALDDATIANTNPGRAGSGGIGGNPGSNNGPDGVVGAMLEVTP